MLLFVVGWVVVTTVVVVRRVVLQPRTYTTSLVSTNAYDRVYTQVLADPQVARLHEQLLGGLGLSASTSTEVRVFTVNALRLTVPPSMMRSFTEQVITSLLAYVRGDTSRLDVDVGIQSALANIDDTAVVEARTVLAGAVDRTVASLPELEAAVRRFADQLAAGTVPDSVPVINVSSFDPTQVTTTILDALGPIVTDDVRQQVLAAVTSGDERDALITAASSLVATHASRIAVQLAAPADGGGHVDLIAAIATHAHQPATTVVGSLDTVRDVARWFDPMTGFVGVLIAIAAAGGLAVMHRRSPKRLLLVLAGTLVFAGAVQLGLWALAAHLAPTPFDEATSNGASSWHLPPGLRSLLSDIQDALTRDVLRAAAWLALVAIAAGVVLAIAAALRPMRVRHIVAIAGAVSVLLIVGTVITSVSVARPPSERACNGHVELCDRHYDDVVYAATHNAMSSPDVVRVWPEQDENLRQQLDVGVRALLIDTHYWLPVKSPTDLIDVQQAIDAAEPRLPRAVAEALYPILGTLRNGREGTFLCHLQCAFGAIPFVNAMATVREFLQANPDEVVTLIIQDAISTADTVTAMHAAGLDPYLYQHDTAQKWPTLGQMIDDGHRLVVFAEDAGPPPSWYANAFKEMQETPFTVASPDQFTCTANRGVADAPLFLMNHWVARVPPDRVNATIVNTKKVLVDRAQECERERGLRPNYLAVDYSNIGDVLGAVDELNGVS